MSTPPHRGRERERERERIEDDRFHLRYTKSDLGIVSQFLDRLLPSLSRDICRHCSSVLSDRFRFLYSESYKEEPYYNKRNPGKFSTRNEDNYDVDSLLDTRNGKAWKYKEDCFRDGATRPVPNPPIRNVDECSSSDGSFGSCNLLSDRVEEERLDMVPRFMNVERKKDFVCLERVDGKLVNILEGLELHTGVFSVPEQEDIIDYIFELQEKGRRGKLKERTYSAPKKWMRGKGRETIQFGCCYNYATDKKGNLPGILYDEVVDPLPRPFKFIIRRLVEWHILPPSCVPDSCIVNIYEEEDCIPPHIDSHDFLRPFCTVSLLSECNIVFGKELKIVGPGEFTGDYEIPLPVGSVLVMSGNGADVAKHCIPAVPKKRISITFRTMDETKRPTSYRPDPFLQGLRPICYNHESPNSFALPEHTNPQRKRRRIRLDDEEPRYSSKKKRGSPRDPGNRMR